MTQENLPPSPDNHELSAPASEEHHSAGGHPRQRFWNRFGGDGFLISLGLHIILGIIGAYVIYQKYSAPEAEVEDFTTGAGGGSGGANAKMFEQRIKPKNPRNLVKSQNKLAVKGGKASVALPDMPQMQMSALESGALSGGASKGFGGGSGGGDGTGMGLGKGGGKNMVSIFGMKGFGIGGLVGSFYDLKQTADGQPTEIAPDEGQQAYVDKLREYCRSGFKEGVLVKYFKSPEKLSLSQVYITKRPADSAPAAYEVAGKVKPSRWLAHYSGKLKAPKSGRFRLVGLGDDILTVYWDGKAKLDSGYDFLSVKLPLHSGTNSKIKPRNNTGTPITAEQAETWTPGHKPGAYPIRVGDWIDVSAGRECKVDILIGETPGGVFEAYLAMEEAAVGEQRKGSGNLLLFKIGNDPVPDEIAKGSDRLRCDMTGGDWIWQPVQRRVGR